MRHEQSRRASASGPAAPPAAVTCQAKPRIAIPVGSSPDIYRRIESSQRTPWPRKPRPAYGRPNTTHGPRTQPSFYRRIDQTSSGLRSRSVFGVIGKLFLQVRVVSHSHRRENGRIWAMDCGNPPARFPNSAHGALAFAPSPAERQLLRRIAHAPEEQRRSDFDSQRRGRDLGRAVLLSPPLIPTGAELSD